MDLNLEYFRDFVTVAKTGSLTAAARELSVSQPAVSQKIHEMEAVLRVTLFERTARGVRLTNEGELLYGYAARGIEQIETGEKKLSQMLSLDIGELHIGASDMTLHFYLLPYLEKYHEQHPGIKMSITNAPTPETIELLQQSSIDFGVVSGPLDELLQSLPGAEAIPVRKIRDIFVAGAKYEALRHKVLRWQDLEELPLIFLEEKTSSRRFLDRFMQEQGVVLQPEFELATSDMIVQFAARNLGIGCVVGDFAKEYLDRGELFELSFEEEIPEREFYIIINRDDYLPAAAKGLLDLIRGDLAAGAGGEHE
ncbi:DNA-binding transcriptional regulator, LysR family [Lachnospiraceae bacterium NK3A20]|nr:DNA-binding transcriptional regulator, LysR family [Lachnospiraceae bacterium NK3A20]